MMKAIRDGLIRWGIPTAMAAIPFAVWFNQVREVLQKLGWQGASLLISFLLFAVAWLVIELIKANGKVKNLTMELYAECDKDITKNLEPLPESGFQKDKRNGEVVCQKCLVEHKMISYLKYNREGRFPYYHCNGCGCDFDA